MKLAAIVVAVALLSVACAGVAEASWLSDWAGDIIGTISDFASETATSAVEVLSNPDEVGVVPGESFTLAGVRAWDVGNVPGLSLLDMYGGVTISPEPPVLGGIATVKVTNVKGTSLCVGARTVPSEDAEYVVDVWGLRLGIEPICAIQHAI